MGARGSLSSARRLVGSLLREAQLYPAMLRARTRPRVAFLPNHAKVGSGLLRAQNVATGSAAQGWASIVVASNLDLAQRNRVLRRFRPDAVVLQTTRHPLNRAEYLKDRPIVPDLDNADLLNPAAALVLQDVATQARAVMAGSRFIGDWASQFNGNVSIVWTGTPLSNAPRPDHRNRQPIVTWAQADPLAYRDELLFCREVMLAVAGRTGCVVLRLYGCAGQDGHPVLRDLASAGVRLQLLPRMGYDAFLASLQETAIGLSPLSGKDFSLGKSFGKILGYIDARVPVVCSDGADHALFFGPQSGVVSNDPAVWVEAICRLLADPAARNRMADAAHDAALSRLSLDAVTRQVHAILSRIRDEDLQLGSGDRLAAAQGLH